MLDRPSILAVTAVVALVVGFALSFFELIILGVILAMASAVAWYRGRRRHADA